MNEFLRIALQISGLSGSLRNTHNIWQLPNWSFEASTAKYFKHCKKSQEAMRNGVWRSDRVKCQTLSNERPQSKNSVNMFQLYRVFAVQTDRARLKWRVRIFEHHITLNMLWSLSLPSPLRPMLRTDRLVDDDRTMPGAETCGPSIASSAQLWLTLRHTK